jgi:hypothetical protein
LISEGKYKTIQILNPHITSIINVITPGQALFPDQGSGN